MAALVPLRFAWWFTTTSLAPTETEVVGSPAQLLDALHLVLVMTYNRLSREYNLAGFRQE